MKITEIEQLDEVPAGMIGQAAKKLGSRVLNKVPGGAAKSKAANIAAKADLGDTANILHKEFNAYLGSQDKNMNQATGEDMAAFIKSKRHQTKASIPQGTLTDKQVNDILMTVAKEAMAKRAGATSDKAPSSGDDEQKAGGSGEQKGDEPEIKFAPDQPVKFKGRDGTDKDGKVVDKGKDEDHVKVETPGGLTVDVPRKELINPNTGKPFQPGDKPADPTKPQIPADIQKQLAALTDEQKQQLASLL